MFLNSKTIHLDIKTGEVLKLNARKLDNALPLKSKRKQHFKALFNTGMQLTSTLVEILRSAVAALLPLIPRIFLPAVLN